MVFHKIETEDLNGKTFIKKIVCDSGNVFEMSDKIQGYEGKTIAQLIEEGEIKRYVSDTEISHLNEADVIEFTRPISLDRLLVMFGVLGKEEELMDVTRDLDREGAEYTEEDYKKYVF